MSFFDRIAESDLAEDDPHEREQVWDPPKWVKGPPLGVAGGVVPFRHKLVGLAGASTGPVDLLLRWPGASVAETMTPIPAESIAEGRADITHPW